MKHVLSSQYKAQKVKLTTLSSTPGDMQKIAMTPSERGADQWREGKRGIKEAKIP